MIPSARLLAVIVLFVAACSTAIPHSPAQDERGVRDAMSGFMDALNALDVPRMSSYFADDVTAFVPTAQPDRVEGRAALTQIFQRFADRVRASTPRLSLKPEDLEIVVAGDMALASFDIREPAATRRRTFVFVRRNGAWLIRHMHASDFLQR